MKSLMLFFTLAFSAVLGQAQNWTNSDHNLVALAQTDQYLNLFIKTDFSSQYSGEELNDFIIALHTKRASFKRDRDFLHYLFFKTHRKLLKQYVEYCPFDALIKSGTYNCLTGTALYAVLLHHFNFEYEVIETNYHIFLIVNSAESKILFEATDPVTGFVESSHEIQTRISNYKESQIIKSNKENSYYRYDYSLYNSVNMEQLLGLMYYNLAIDAYNKHDLSRSVNYLYQSAKLYQSPRIDSFSKIILLTVAEQNLTIPEKEVCLKKIQLLRGKMPGLTSAK